MKKYGIRKEKEFGCTIYSVYNKETNIRVNYFANMEDAQAFMARQIHAIKF